MQPWRPGLAFVLNNRSVLRVASRSEIMEMLQLDELTKVEGEVFKTTSTVLNVVLSLNGDTLFVLTKPNRSQRIILMGWDISSGLLKPGKEYFVTELFVEYNLVAVREGVLLQTSRDTLELCNPELSECIRSWTGLEDITQVIPISEERVACNGITSDVIILDTTREGILSTIPIHGRFVACNSKCYVITADEDELQMHCGDKVLWKMTRLFDFRPCKTFSPTEQYCVLSEPLTEALYVLDVVLGKILRRIQPRIHEQRLFKNVGCQFLSDEECVTCFGIKSTGYFLQLFNVKSGDLLSEIVLESRVCSLAACPRERLIAVGFTDSKVNFKVLQVKLPGDKHSRKNKRIKPKE